MRLSNELSQTYVPLGRHFGVDEAGRGALAGPLAVAAVEWPWTGEIPVKDSKRLTHNARERLFELIVRQCKYTVCFIDAEWIDANGIQAAQTAGLFNVVNTLAQWDNAPWPGDYPDLVVVDGTPGGWQMQNDRPGDSVAARMKFMIKADGRVAAVSAASIVAKVSRDRYMEDSMHTMFPAWDFDVHKGYGTELHLSNLEDHGVSPIHRRTFAPVERVLNASRS